MKHIKKVVTLMLAFAMVLAMSAVSFAATPQGGLTVDPKISVTGLQDGDQVTFYRVLKWDNGWVTDAGFTLTDEELATVVGTATTPGTISATLAGTLGTQAASAEKAYGPLPAADGKVEQAMADNSKAGLYIAIITPAKTGYTYNPVFVGADFQQPESGADTSSTWNVTTDLSYSPVAMAKKAEVPLEKTAVDEDSQDDNKSETVAVGDTVNFTVTTSIPGFADNYTKPVFKVSDTLSTGLELTTNSVTLSKPTGLTKDIDYTITESGKTGFVVAFKDTYLKTVKTATPVEIKYSAVVTSAAAKSVNHEDNTVTVNYSNSPSDTEGHGVLKDKTNHYTFDIDGDLWGSSEYKATEVVKVGVDKNGKEITETVTLSNGKTVGALQGAEFKLYSDEACTQEVSNPKLTQPIVTDEQGRMTMKGLDAGKYWIKETKAPDGYIANTEKHSIEIKPVVEKVQVTESDGTTYETNILKSYTVEVDGVQTASYTVDPTGTVTREEGKTTTISYENSSDKVTDISAVNAGDTVVGADGLIGAQGAGANAAAGKITNTQGTELPSTGGIGTVIFYVLGSLLVVGCGIVLISKRRLNSTK